MVVGFVAAGAIGAGIGFWAGDTSQEVLTKQAELETKAVELANANERAAIAEAVSDEKTRQIAILQQTAATGALLAARLARDEADAKAAAAEAEDKAREVTAELVAERAKLPPGCACRFTSTGVRRLQSLGPQAPSDRGGDQGGGAKGAVPAPPR